MLKKKFMANREETIHHIISECSKLVEKIL